MPEYSFEEFIEIAISRLAKENVKEKLVRFISEKIWYELGSKDIREVIKVARLSNSIEEASFVVRMLNRRYRIGDTN